MNTVIASGIMRILQINENNEILILDKASRINVLRRTK